MSDLTTPPSTLIENPILSEPPGTVYVSVSAYANEEPVPTDGIATAPDHDGEADAPVGVVPDDVGEWEHDVRAPRIATINAARKGVEIFI